MDSGGGSAQVVWHGGVLLDEMKSKSTNKWMEYGCEDHRNQKPNKSNLGIFFVGALVRSSSYPNN